MKNLINEVANLTINEVENDSNGVTASDIQVQFSGNPAVISHQNLLSVWAIRTRQEEFPVLVHTKEPIIGTKNELSMNNNTEVKQTPQGLKKHTMKELITDTTPYIMMNADMTPCRISRNGIDGYTPYYSGSGTSAVAICPSPTPPSVFIWNDSIGNIGHTVTHTTPSFRYTHELDNFIDRIFTKYSNVTSFVSQILRDELFISSGRNIYSLCRMEVAADTLKPMVPQLVSHGLPTIDTLNSNSGICIHATITIKKYTE